MSDHPIHHDPTIGLTVTARPGPNGLWIVNFLRRRKMTKQLDQNAAWMTSGEWDRGRWHPIGSRLVPPAALAAVEAWLQNRPALQEVAR